MLSVLPPVLRGVLATAIIVLNIVALVPVLLVIALMKMLVPIHGWRVMVSRWMTWLAEIWIDINNFSLALTQSTVWDVEGVGELDREGWYLILSNHQSWADILVLQRVFQRKTPFLKFFLKQQLIWVPLLGLAWWALDFPFMKRYSREQVEANPDLKGKDLETTQRACEKFRHHPISVFNFVEGTRYTAQKSLGQQSPYRYLLKPRAGGVGFVVSAMGEQITTMLNVTIVYAGPQPRIWDFLCGRVPKLIVRVEEAEIPAEFLGRNYVEDESFRLAFQEWVRELWEKKDAQIAELRRVELGEGEP